MVTVMKNRLTRLVHVWPTIFARWCGAWSIVGMAILMAVGCGHRDDYPNRPITLVCPWGRGGGTDRVSRQMAEFLSKELGVPVNVINATGGKGVTGHSRGLRARPDGYTIAMITLELNMMHWSGLTRLTYKDCEPLMSINEDACALFVRHSAPWQTLAELEQEIRTTPGQLKASGTASGGAWHLGLAGWLTASGMDAEDVIWVSSTGAGPSLQELISGGLDMVACSLPESQTLLESNQIRALGVMAPERAPGFPEVKTFMEQGVDWTLQGWRGLAVAKDTPRKVTDRLVLAIQRIVDGQTTVRMLVGNNESFTTFAELMQSQKFDHTWRPPEQFRQFMQETDAKLGKLLTSDAMRSVNTDRFNPMAFPTILLVWLALASAGLVLQRYGRRAKTTGDTGQHQAVPTRRGVLNFCALVGAIVLYLVLAELFGFVLVAGAMLFCLLYLLGTRLWVSAVISLVVTSTIYQLFAHFLRVPLPGGWLSW